MDETSDGILNRVTIKYVAPREIAPGKTITTFYDCRLLTPNDLARLAAEAVGHLSDHAFDIAVGAAYSGILFAAAVAGGKQVAISQKDGILAGPNVAGRKVMICDDVVSTGEQLQKIAKKVRENGGEVVGFACIVDRLSKDGMLAGLPLYSAFRE
jgi:orotate phosphoribosyltransferase